MVVLTLWLALAASAPVEPPNWVQCVVLWVHDGDTLRCQGLERSSRLYAIDAPEVGECLRGRICTPGDGKASREHLVRLVGDRVLECATLGTDRYRRPVMQCFAGPVDLSCAMVADGFAVERYGRLRCKPHER